jgi:hypothetical protein
LVITGTYEEGSIILRESEVAAFDGNVSYNLRLSAEPKKPVTITVAIEKGSTASCVNQADRLFLSEASSLLLFTPANWHEDQTVVARVPRDATFQGNIQAIFTHATSFSGFFSPPVSLSLVDDDECSPGAVVALDEESGVRICQCLPGYYVEQQDPAFCNSATACRECVDGMLCNDFNTHLADMKIEAGQFRMTSESTTVVACPKEDACKPLSPGVSGNELCAEGHVGPMCQVCNNDLGGDIYVWSGERCIKCESGQSTLIYALLGVLVLVFILTGAYIMKGKTIPKMMTNSGPGAILAGAVMKDTVPKMMENTGAWEDFLLDAETKYKETTLPPPTHAHTYTYFPSSRAILLLHLVVHSAYVHDYRLFHL